MSATQHPADERLAALAGADPEVAADAALREHVASCARCRDITQDLMRLRAALAELPDVAPPAGVRPFAVPAAEAEQRRIPVPLDVGPRRAGGFFGALRGALAPVMVAGAAIALVGAVGTTGYFDDSTLMGGAGAPAAAPDAAGGGDSQENAHPEDAGEPGSATGATPTAVAIYSTDDEPQSARSEAGGDRVVRGGRMGSSGDGLPWLALLVGGAVVAVGAFVLRGRLSGARA